jgi:hypothetical protein
MFRYSRVRGWVVQHVREIRLSQREASTCEIDRNVSIEDLPPFVLDDAGIDPQGGGPVHD